MLALDTAAYNSPWRTRHPGEKALLSLGLLGCALALPTWPAAAIVAAVATSVLLGPAAVRLAQLWHAMRAPMLFIGTGAVPLLVSVSSPVDIGWQSDGLAAAATLTGRATACLLCLLLFAATTPLADVLPRLTRFGVPVAVTEVAALTYRMVFLLLDSARAVREAQAARLGYRTWATSYRSVAVQAAAIFIRAFDRARRLEEGLALRGYTGSLRVQVETRRVSPVFVVATLLVLAAVVGSTYAIRLAMT